MAGFRSQPLSTRSLLSVTPAEHLGGTEGRPSRTAVALSRDGRTLVFTAWRPAQPPSYLRPLNQAQAVKLSGYRRRRNPFFSPDGQWVRLLGQWRTAESADLGRPAVRVAQTSPIFGASWGDDDRIVYSSADGALSRFRPLVEHQCPDRREQRSGEL